MRSLKQQILLLVIGPLIILSICVSVLTGFYMKNRALLATDTKARSDLAAGEAIIELMYPGQWEVRNGILYKGGVKITNNFAPVDKIAGLTGDTVTIFLGDTRVSTTVREKTGERAIGTRVSDEVANQVLKNGHEYIGQANVVGQIFQTAYKPIRDSNGKIIGMFYVGISKKLSDQLISNSLVTMVTITVILTLTVALGAWYFTQWVIIGPLQEITAGTKKVASGQSPGKLEINSTQEIAELANAFNQMVEGLQQIAVHIGKAGATAYEQTELPLTVKPMAALPDISRFQLPKGLNENTQKQIIMLLTETNTFLSAEEAGNQTGISSVTARRYLEFLEKIGLVEVETKYGTVGRPVKLYKYIF